MTTDKHLLNRQKRLMFINRQPSLWRHSCPVVQVEPIEDDDNETIQVSPLMIEALNMDFDGDTAALYVVHDTQAIKEMEEKAYWQNTIHYDQNSDFLSIIRHEALYSAFVLTREEFDKDKVVAKINNLKKLPETYDLWNNHIYSAVEFKDQLYSYGIALFNKWCGFSDIIINKSINKSMTNFISETIYNYNNKNNKKYYDALCELEKKLFLYISVVKYVPSLDVTEMVNLKDEETAQLLKKLPDNNVMLGYHINEAMIERCIHHFDKESNLYKLYKSGSRFQKMQLARSCISIGYSANADNVVIPTPVKTSLLEGLTEKEFFIVAPGTRKSIKDKSNFTPDSGFVKAHFKLREFGETPTR